MYFTKRNRKLTLEQFECRRLLTASLASSGHESTASFRVVLISDAVGQALQVRQSSVADVVSVVYDSESMTTTKLVETLSELSAARGGAAVSHLAIVAHGAPGQLAVGAELWNRQQLDNEIEAFKQLNAILMDQARLDLYGCQVASGSEGYAFAEKLAELTGTNVYASENSVGSGDLGDYEWEFRSGPSSISDELLSVEQLENINGLALPLSTPILSSPTNSATNQSLTPTLSWQAVSGAANYRVVVSTSQAALPTGSADPSLTFPYTFNNTTSSTSLTLPALSTSTTYYWEVRAGNSGTQQGSLWSAQRSFTTAAPLSVPILTSPANGVTNQSLLSTLTWQAVSNATSYRLLVSTSQAALPTGANNPTGSYVYDQVLSSTSFQATLNAGTTYYWEVRAGNSSLSLGSLWSAQRSLTTAAPLSVPILTSPANGVTNQSLLSTLTWQAVSNATSYRLLVSTSQAALPTGANNPTGSYVYDQVLSSTSFQATLNAGTTYYWEVRAGNSSLSLGSLWSAQRSLTTAAPLSVPILTSPNNGATNQSLLSTLTWQAVSGATSYRVLVSTSQAALPTGANDPTGTYVVNQLVTTTSLAVPLNAATTYYWEVRAGNTDLALGSLWSAQRSLTTAAPLSVPILTSPNTGATNQSLLSTLTWQAVSGATSYRVLVSTSQAALPTGANDPTGSYVVNQLVTTTSLAVPLNAGTTYYWEVRAGNTDLALGSLWSAQRSLTTAAPLSVPILTSPVNGATNQSLLSTLTWQAVSGATSYRVLVSTSQAALPTGANDPTGSYVVNQLVTTTSLAVTFNAGTTYYWEVRAGNTDLALGSLWSAQRSLTTAAPLSVPILTSPVNGATNQSLLSTLTWQAVSGATSYRVLVSTSQAALPTGANDPTGTYVVNQLVTTTSLAVPLNAATTYYWEVRAGNTDLALGSLWSEQRSLTTAAPLSVPILTSPVNGATNQSLLSTLTWQAVSGATSYRVLVSTSQAALPTGANDPTGSYVVNQLVTTTSLAVTLNAGTTYYWEVRAGNTDLALGSLWSEQRSLSTGTTSGIVFPTTVLLQSNSDSIYAQALNPFASQYSNQTLEGQCTWYAYGRVIELADTGYLDSSAKQLMINAFWHSSNRHAINWPSYLGGTWTDTTSGALPMDLRVPGQLVVWNVGTRGHVAFIEEVSADKTKYRVSEYNITPLQLSTQWLDFDGSGRSRFGGTFPKFYQLPLPSVTALAAPPILNGPGNLASPGSNLSTTQPTFQWQAVPGATQYDLRIRKMNPDGSAGDLVFEAAAQGLTINGTSTSYTLPAGILENGGYYRWSMRTRDNNGWGTVYAPAIYFSVNSQVVSAYNQPFLSDLDLVAANAMSEVEIRNFLTSHGSYFAQPRLDVDGVSFDAALVIYNAAQQYTINPEVLLTTLQKENGAVNLATRPSDAVMRTLMGAGTAAQTARDQLMLAAERFRSYHNSLLTNGQTISGWKAGVPKATADGLMVIPATNAIAGQFTYTPHAGIRWGGTSTGGVSLFAQLWQQYGFGGVWSDTELPIVTSASADQSSLHRNTNIQFSWTATDNVAVHHTALYLYQNGVAVDTSLYGVVGGSIDGRITVGAEYILNTGNGTYPWTVFNTLQPGSYRIKVVAWDTAGQPSSGTLDGGGQRYKWIDFVVANAAPTISNISNTSTLEDTASAQLTFTVADLETAADALVVSATSSDPTLVPIANISLGGSGLTRTLTLMPAANRYGTAIINVTVRDADNEPASQTFLVNVSPVGDTPQVTNMFTSEDTLSDTITIDRHTLDGTEVSHFRVSGIVGGTLFLSDGSTPIADGQFLTYTQAHAGVRFLPNQDSNSPGAFDVESSQDGLVVAAQSGKARSTINISPINDAPTDINLSASNLSENQAGATIGILSVSDPDLDDHHLLSVDDIRFEVLNGLLKLKAGISLDYEAAATLTVNVTATDAADRGISKPFTISIIDLPELIGNVVIDDGTGQRSQVQKVTATFDGAVLIGSDAFAVQKRGPDGGIVATTATTTVNSTGQTVVTLTFSGAFTRAGALIDGYYQLTIDGTKISRLGQQLDINGDGQGGDSYTIGTSEADNFFALYGDLNGDGLVGIVEYGQFRNAFGKTAGQIGYNPLFDYENDGVVGIADLGQFRSRFGKAKPAFQ